MDSMITLCQIAIDTFFATSLLIKFTTETSIKAGSDNAAGGRRIGAHLDIQIEAEASISLLVVINEALIVDNVVCVETRRNNATCCNGIICDGIRKLIRISLF